MFIKSLITLLLLSNLLQTNALLKPQEEELFSFSTERKKTVVVARDKNDAYLVYRFGTTEKIDLEYPKVKTDSWQKFTYSGYFRPPQGNAEGMDENNVTFVNGRFEYTLYDTTVSADDGNHFELGIKVKNLDTGAVTDIKGVKSTQRGTLASLRDNSMIKQKE